METVEDGRVESIMAQVYSLPSIPAASSKILALMDDPKTGPDQVERVLRHEPGLTANLLRLSNSAYFGLPSRIGSVRQAVVMLGWKRVAQLVATSCLGAIMQRSVPGYDLPSGAMLRHSIAVAVTAETIVSELGLGEAEEVYTAALLHDVGKLVLGRFVEEQRSAIEERLDEGVSFEIAERETLGADHAQVGARILNRWSLPERIVEVVRWHHEPERAPGANAMVDVVHIADVTCLMIGQGVGREGLQYAPSAEAVSRLGLGLRQLEKIASLTLGRIDELNDALAAG